MSGYCKHGVYVGGCGIDWMCGACEMGDPDPTVRDEQRIIARSVRKMVDLGMGLGARYPEIIPHLIRPTLAEIQTALSAIKEIRRWATDDDDDNWMIRRHNALEAEAAEWERDNDSRHVYTEIDEIHEYGMVP